MIPGMAPVTQYQLLESDVQNYKNFLLKNESYKPYKYYINSLIILFIDEIYRLDFIHKKLACS